VYGNTKNTKQKGIVMSVKDFFNKAFEKTYRRECEIRNRNIEEKFFKKTGIKIKKGDLKTYKKVVKIEDRKYLDKLENEDRKHYRRKMKIVAIATTIIGTSCCIMCAFSPTKPVFFVNFLIFSLLAYINFFRPL